MLKSLFSLHKERMSKTWTDEARRASTEARRAKETDPNKIARRREARRKLMGRIDAKREKLGLKPLFKTWTDEARQASAEARAKAKIVDRTKKEHDASISRLEAKHNRNMAEERLLRELKRMRNELDKPTLGKGWTEEARQASIEARRKKSEEEKAKPAQRKLSENEAFKFYVKIKDGAFGNNVQVKLLNSQVGRMEGIAKAYRERAGKLPDGAKKDKLLRDAYKLHEGAREVASKRDSLLGRLAEKISKQDLSEQEILDMIDAGEFNDFIESEIEQYLGEKIEKGWTDEARQASIEARRNKGKQKDEYENDVEIPMAGREPTKEEVKAFNDSEKALRQYENIDDKYSTILEHRPLDRDEETEHEEAKAKIKEHEAKKFEFQEKFRTKDNPHNAGRYSISRHQKLFALLRDRANAQKAKKAKKDKSGG